MGNWFAKLFNFSKEKKLLMLGLDAAGKTTILYALKLNECITSIPTIGFNVEEVNYKNLNMSIWDIGGQDKIRRLWKYYYENCDGLIFVVDSADKNRFKEAKRELHKLHITHELIDVPFLIFNNKKDIESSFPVSEMVNMLSLNDMHGRKWYIQACSATNGEGLYEGLEWLRNQIDG